MCLHKYMSTKKNADKKRWGRYVSGGLLIGLGVVFLLNNLGYTSVNLSVLWPVFIIIPGIFILFGHHEHD